MEFQYRPGDTRPSARTLRLRFAYTNTLIVLSCVCVWIIDGDVFAGVFMAGVAGAGVAGGVLYLDTHRFFAASRVAPRRRKAIVRMLIGTGLAFAVALAVAVAFASPVGLAVAVALGAVTGIYATQALWDALSRAS